MQSLRGPALGWLLVESLAFNAAECIAGLRIGHAPKSAGLMQHFDHVLLDRDEVWPAVRPDVVLQLGGRITSKRVSEFLSWAAQPSVSRYFTLFF